MAPSLLSALLLPAALTLSGTARAQTAPTTDVPAHVDDALVVLAGADHACRVTWKVGADGLPTGAEATDCSGVLADAAEAAALQWVFPAGDAPFTYKGVVGIVPHPLDLEDVEPVAMAPVVPPPDRAPVLRKTPKVRLPGQVRALLRDHDQRFAWEPCDLQVRVDAAGKVTAAAPVACAQLLWPVAEQAATRARFDPATRDGQPVEATAPLRLVFSELP